MKQPPVEPPARKWMAGSQVGFAAAGLLLLVFAANYYWNQPALWIALPVCYIAITLWLRSRLLACALIGLVLGAMLIDTGSSSQSETYRIWQPVWAVGVGLLIGLVMGFIWDRAQSFDADFQQAKPKRQRGKS